MKKQAIIETFGIFRYTVRESNPIRTGEKPVKKLLIIGGGVSGLSAGIHARLLGFECTVAEKNPHAGGISTTWERDGYHLDASLHWLTGTQQGNSANEMWKTLGVLGDHAEIVKTTTQGVIEFEEGQLNLYADLNALRAELLRIAPEDQRMIRQLMGDIKAVGGMDMPADAPIEFLNKKEKLALLLPTVRMGMRVGKRISMSNEEYSRGFKNPLLRKYFSAWPLGQDQHMGFLFKAAMMARGNADYLKGGSRQLVQSMVQRFKELGGELITSKEAVKINTENGRMTEVLFRDGSTMTADYLLCACDPYITLHQLLDGAYPVKEFEERYQNRDRYFVNSCCIAFFGLDLIPENHSEEITFPGEPLTVSGITVDRFPLRAFVMEPEFAPEGHLLLSMDIIQQDDDFAYWKNLRQDLPAYRAEKQRITQELTKRILARFPDWEGHLSPIDFLTPMTYHRYTGAYHGAWMAFRTQGDGERMTHTGEIPGLENVMLTGQWLQPPGGLPVAAAMSKFSVQRIAKKEGMSWRV